MVPMMQGMPGMVMMPHGMAMAGGTPGNRPMMVGHQVCRLGAAAALLQAQHLLHHRSSGSCRHCSLKVPLATLQCCWAPLTLLQMMMMPHMQMGPGMMMQQQGGPGGHGGPGGPGGHDRGDRGERE
jgi:hypothetical protein